MMLTDADLSAMTAQYQGNTISAIQAKPESLTSLEHLIVDMGFEPGDYLVLMRRNINRCCKACPNHSNTNKNKKMPISPRKHTFLSG